MLMWKSSWTIWPLLTIKWKWTLWWFTKFKVILVLIKEQKLTKLSRDKLSLLNWWVKSPKATTLFMKTIILKKKNHQSWKTMIFKHKLSNNWERSSNNFRDWLKRKYWTSFKDWSRKLKSNSNFAKKFQNMSKSSMKEQNLMKNECKRYKNSIGRQVNISLRVKIKLSSWMKRIKLWYKVFSRSLRSYQNQSKIKRT